MPVTPSTRWIFFDCFNTLIDDFDATGDESGLGSLPDLAVEIGAALTREDFVSAYRGACPIDSGEYAEVLFTSRLVCALESIGRLPPEDVARAAVPARALARRV